MIRCKENKGFTLAELLIVVAIIAVLVAIAIPIFTTQLEKSREATDLANVRGAYAEVMAAANLEDKASPLYSTTNKEYSKIVTLKQKKDGWSSSNEIVIGGISSVSDKGGRWRNNPKAEGTCKVIYDEKNQEPVIIWEGYTLKLDYQWQIGNGKVEIVPNSTVSKWPCNAIPELMPASNNSGQQVLVAGIDDKTPILKKGQDEGYRYDVGYFILDNNNNILVDSGRLPITGAKGYDIATNKATDGSNVNIAIQIFKVKTDSPNARSYEISEAEARELERLISVR